MTVTAWFSVVNTVFASIAFLVWCVAVWTEDQDKLDDDKIVIIDDIEEEGDEDEREEKHLYVRPDLRTSGNLLNYRDYCCYVKNSVGHGVMGSYDINKANQIDEDNKKAVDIIGADHATHVDEDNKKAVDDTGADQTSSPRPSTTPFQWPQQEAVVESVILAQAKTRHILSTEVMERIKELGLSRTRTMAGEMGGRLGEKARLAGKMLGKKEVRMGWDVFLAKERPGLEGLATMTIRGKKNKKQKEKHFQNSTRYLNNTFNIYSIRNQ